MGKIAHPIPIGALALLSQLLVEERVEPVELNIGTVVFEPLTVLFSYFLGVVIHDGIVHELHRPQCQQVVTGHLHRANHLILGILVSQPLHKLGW